MVPSWVLTAVIVFAGCILALYVGSTLPEYDYFGWYIVGVTVLCTVAAVTNNFPFLLAAGTWMPVSVPFMMFSQFPVIVLIVIWISLILFFRMCLTGTIAYLKSFNLFFLVVFSWVVIRFMMNPVHKLGASVGGGSGVSGAAPYFGYVVAAMLLLTAGAILNTRDKVMTYMLWCFRLVFIIGVTFLICAFIPATAPYFYAWGIFSAGSMGDGILRFVEMPGYGFFLVQAALCPYLFKLKQWHCLALLALGFAMIIVGGNRSTIAESLVALPTILILRRSTHVLLAMAGLAVVGIIVLRFTVAQQNENQISPLVRSLGIFDSKIDEASGGSASAKWRYDVWDSGIEKIMENPMIGKGFGNLPKHLDPTSTEVMESTDFEVILAGGMAHNGFITAAYGFGIPFMLALTGGLFVRFFFQVKMALESDRHDREMRDLHAFLASMYPALAVGIYTAFDMSTTSLWVYVALGFILENLPKGVTARDSAPATAQPTEAYMYPSRY